METARLIFETVGLVVELEEGLMNAVTALSGSGPAFVLLVLEALAEAGVAQGLDKKTAYLLAGQTLKGAGELYLKTGETPKSLREGVTSPGGTTAAGLMAFEDGMVQKAFKEAVRRATQRARELGKGS